MNFVSCAKCGAIWTALDVAESLLCEKCAAPTPPPSSQPAGATDEVAAVADVLMQAFPVGEEHSSSAPRVRRIVTAEKCIRALDAVRARSQPAGVGERPSMDDIVFANGRAAGLEEAAVVGDTYAVACNDEGKRLRAAGDDREADTEFDRAIGAIHVAAGIRSLIPTTTPPGDAHGRDREGAVSRVQAGVPVAAEVVPALRDAEPVAEVVSTTTPAADGREGGAAPAAKPEHAASPGGGLLVCHICGKPAACIGKYDNMTKPEPSCDECCGHGNEDGWCKRIETAAAAPGVSGEGRACETCGGGEPTSSYKHYPGCEAAEEERMAAAERRGAESERRRVVEWLKERVGDWWPRSLAEQIEAGRHTPEGDGG